MTVQGMDTPTPYTESEEVNHSLSDELPQGEPRMQSPEDEYEEQSLFEGWEEDFLNTPWLRRNWLFMVFVIICGLVSIAWPYVYVLNLREVTSLEMKLRDIRYKSLFISAERIEYERIGNILDRVGEYHLPLVPATQPPYLLLDTGQYALPTPEK